MSTPDRDEFETLLAAHAGKSLTAAETTRLRALAATTPEQHAELGAIDELHAWFGDERELFDAVRAPVTPREEQDEGFARVAAAAAAAEDVLRAQLRHAAPALHAGTPSRRSRRMLIALVAVAAVVVCAVALLFRTSDRPPLLDGRPGDAVLGTGTRIVLQTELRAAHPELSWHAIVGASRYDASIDDGDGHALFVRSEDHARTTVWELTPDQVATLRARAAQGDAARLRIVARDGAGIAIATSGDLPLRIVD